MTTKTRIILLAMLSCLMAFNLASSCGDDDDDDKGSNSVECDSGSKDMGPNCQAIYDKIMACCDDQAMAKEDATTLVCGMEVDEAACEAADMAADAQCALMAMRPECGDEDAGTQ